MVSTAAHQSEPCRDASPDVGCAVVRWKLMPGRNTLDNNLNTVVPACALKRVPKVYQTLVGGGTLRRRRGLSCRLRDGISSTRTACADDAQRHQARRQRGSGSVRVFRQTAQPRHHESATSKVSRRSPTTRNEVTSGKTNRKSSPPALAIHIAMISPEVFADPVCRVPGRRRRSAVTGVGGALQESTVDLSHDPLDGVATGARPVTVGRPALFHSGDANIASATLETNLSQAGGRCRFFLVLSPGLDGSAAWPRPSIFAIECRLEEVVEMTANARQLPRSVDLNEDRRLRSRR